jgi:NADH-quinone oxidoreductase subunit M
VGIMLLPEGAKLWAPLILGLALINVIYGSLIASVQTDFKYVIGFSSVSHMGLVMLGFATLNQDGLTGAGLQMFSHGVMTALFFAVVGIVYDRAHTREIAKLGGFSKVMPLVAVVFIIGGLVSMGMPGFSGFVAEFPIFLGLWQVQPIVAVVAALGIVITAGYVMRIVGRVFYGDMPSELVGHIGAIRLQDRVALVVLASLLVLLGLQPWVMAPMIASGAQSVLRLVGGG